jgi:hypothetical protein
LNFQHTSSTLPSIYVVLVVYYELKKKMLLAEYYIEYRWSIRKRLLITKSARGIAI